MEIIRYGKNSKKSQRQIYFYCENKDCECVFKENIQKVLIDTTIYGLFRNKREIRYRCSCPECGRVVTAIERPDEESDI